MKSSKISKITAWGGGVALALSLVACSSGDSAGTADGEEVMKIGVPIGLTGAIADQAARMKDGYELFLEENGGEVGGIPVSLLYEDTQSDANLSVQKARQLLRDQNVDLMLGGALAFESVAIAEQAKAAEIAYISPISSADDLTQREFSSMVARTNMTSSQPNMPFGEYAYDELGYRNIAIVAPDYAYGWESAGGFQFGFENAGGTIATKIWVPLDASDWAPYVRQIPEDVDAVYAIPIGAGVQRFVSTFDQYGYRDKVDLIGGPDIADDDALAALGDDAIGLVHVHTYSSTNPWTKDFAEKFNDTYGTFPSYWGESTYTQLMWLDAAIREYRDETGASVAETIEWIRNNPEELITTLRGVSVENAPRGPVSMDDYNNSVQNMYVIEVQEVDGKPTPVTLETFEATSQFWNLTPDAFLANPVFSRTFPE